jgi:hypothetical protein
MARGSAPPGVMQQPQ